MMVARVYDGTPEASAHGLPRVPFYPTHVLPATGAGHAEWLADPARARLRRSLRAAERGGAVLRVYTGELPPAEDLHALFADTAARHADEVEHPIAVTPRVLGAIAALPAALRGVCAVELAGEPIAFSLVLRAGPAALIRTTGVARERSRPVNGYLLLQTGWLELANAWGCAELDLGPTTDEMKARLGATPRATSYLADFRRWWLRPARWLVAARVRDVG
jgi:hypothetical protein